MKYSYMMCPHITIDYDADRSIENVKHVRQTDKADP
jgi:hypothetical protein